MTAQAYQRLLDIALALTAAGKVGVSTPDLMQRVGYPDTDSGKRKMMRDLDDLKASGLVIENAADSGEDGRYVLQPGDVRWRLEFTSAQRSALQAALAAADAGTVSIERSDPPIDLDRVREAVSSSCAMTFRYNGRVRTVDPIAWRWSSHQLVVEGWERDSEMVKSFAVVRILDLELGPPGSGASRPEARRPGLDPITWLVDDPVTATIECPGFTDDVIALVGGEADGDVVHVEVTNRLVFLARIVELGPRARLSGPEQLRTELKNLLMEAM